MLKLKESVLLNTFINEQLSVFDKETKEMAKDLRHCNEKSVDTTSMYRNIFERKLTLDCFNDENAVTYMESVLFNHNYNSNLFKYIDDFVNTFHKNIMYDQDIDQTYESITIDTLQNFY